MDPLQNKYGPHVTHMVIFIIKNQASLQPCLIGQFRILFTPLSNELPQNSAPVFNTRNVINILDRAILFYLLANSAFKRLFCMNKKSLYDEEHFLQLHKIVVKWMSVTVFVHIDT